MANSSRKSWGAIIVILGITCLLIGVVAADETVFDIMNFDAKADGQTDDALAFIQAFRAACDGVGPARVIVPAGKEFTMGEIVFQGPCKATPPITIEINGNLSAVSDPSLYTRNTWLLIDKVVGIKVTGQGTFNGHGQAFWQYADENNHLPVSLILQETKDSEISNLHFVDAMGFHTKVTDSVNVVITNLTITAPYDSPNTDGIHLSNNTNLNITDSVIGTGDDCVSIGDGNVNVLITRVFCGPGHGLSIGSLGKREGETDVNGVSIINCTLTKTTNGARIKSYHASPKLKATKIIFQDIVMNEVKNPIIIDQHYDSKTKPEQSSVQISDVKFINIKGTTISKNPILLNCSSTFPCENIELGEIDFVPVGQMKFFASTCSSAKFAVNGVVNPPMPPACA